MTRPKLLLTLERLGRNGDTRLRHLGGDMPRREAGGRRVRKTPAPPPAAQR